MLPRNQRQEALSRAYVRAIAARAEVTARDIDTDFGIDICLRGVQCVEDRFMDDGSQIDLQVKSTIQANLTDTGVVYDLEMRAYEVLRRERVLCPRYLVLVVLPEEEELWLSQTEEELILRRCAYWMSFRDAPPVPNTRTTRVTIPRENVFSAEAIRELFLNANQEGEPS